MTFYISAPFERRLNRISRVHERHSNGPTRRVIKNGIIVEQASYFQPKFPTKAIAALFVLSFFFKSYVYAELGAGEYAERLALLQNASTVEQMGAWVLQADPVTVFVGGLLDKAGI